MALPHPIRLVHLQLVLVLLLVPVPVKKVDQSSVAQW